MRPVTKCAHADATSGRYVALRPTAWQRKTWRSGTWPWRVQPRYRLDIVFAVACVRHVAPGMITSEKPMRAEVDEPGLSHDHP